MSFCLSVCVGKGKWHLKTHCYTNNLFWQQKIILRIKAVFVNNDHINWNNKTFLNFSKERTNLKYRVAVLF